MEILQKITSSVEISLSQHFEQIYSSHISHRTRSPNFSISYTQDILQILQVLPSSSSSSLFLSFHDSAKLLNCQKWNWLLPLMMYFTDNRTWCSLLSSSSFPQLLRPYFAVTNWWVSYSLRHLPFLGKLFSEISSKFLQ